MGIVVPAHDEATTIGACLRSALASLAAARVDDGWVVVVADRCRDATAAAARAELGPAGEVIEIDAGNVGQARALGTDRLLDRHLGPADPSDDRVTDGELTDDGGDGLDDDGLPPLDSLWLLTTDADTVVPADWVAAHLRLADAGAAAVAGVVRIDSFAEHPPHVEPRHRSVYVFNADGTHGHVHGANLGVRADAYRAVGGWSALPTAEDHDLWNRLDASGWPTVSSIESWVTTSGRALGRAPEGLAWRLGTYGAAP